MTLNFFRLIFLVKLVFSVPLSSIENTNDSPLETQHAVCKVFTKEIEATAKATITRQLKGVCSTRDLNLRFNELYEELQQIKSALGLRESQSQYKSLELLNYSKQSMESSATTDLPMYNNPDYFIIDSEVKQANKENGHKTINNVVQNNLKLNEEIDSFNDTIVESSEGDLFFYYWKIPDIKKVLRKRDIYVSSPTISVLGHTLYLQFYPNYKDDYVGILLKPDSNSFLKKHKILFLGQNPTQNQISSKILYGVKNEERIFKIESEMLDDFINTDSLLVKVKIYLNS